MSFSLISSIFLVIKYTHIRNRMLIVCIENSKKIGNCQKFNRHHVVEVSTLTIGKHCMGHRFYFFFANGTIWILGVMEHFRHQDPVMTIRFFYCTIHIEIYWFFLEMIPLTPYYFIIKSENIYDDVIHFSYIRFNENTIYRKKKIFQAVIYFL